MEKYYLLLAEDNSDDVLLTVEALKESKLFYKIDCVVDGEQLFSFLCDTIRLPDCILSDLNMPKMDGFEALKKIRSHDRLMYIPFIVFSTSKSETDIKRARELGANAFLTKPFGMGEYDLLATTIENYINKTD
jgi:two-component system response regulator